MKLKQNNMNRKLKQHIAIFVVVTIFIHLCTAYLAGSWSFSKDMRECEMIVFIFAQAFAHFAWFNRESIINEMKKELNKNQ